MVGNSPVAASKSAGRSGRRRHPAVDATPPLVVVGNGMVGWRFCHALVERGLHERFALTVLGEEPRPASDRIHLTDCLGGRESTDLQLAPREWYARHRITIAVRGLDDLGTLVPAVQALGKRHAGYGVQDSHYATVAAALLWTLEKGLGSAWNDEVRDSWVVVYTILADTMKQAAA